VIILLKCDHDTVRRIEDSGFRAITFARDAAGNATYGSRRCPVHVDRFLHIHDHLSRNEYRYAVTTDTRDVVFQRNPVEYLEEHLGGKRMVFSSESMRYKDEPWGNQNLLDTYGALIHERYKHNEIYNVGVLAGRADSIMELAIGIVAAAANRPTRICDQSTFNFLIAHQPYRRTCLYATSEDGWACQLGTTADPSKRAAFRPKLLEPEPRLQGDSVVTNAGTEYCIVHQYDRVPEWRGVIERKYG
jgi:hypothetical protein